MARETAINIMSAYYRARINRKFRFPAEMLQAIASETRTSVDLVELVLTTNGVRL